MAQNFKPPVQPIFFEKHPDPEEGGMPDVYSYRFDYLEFLEYASNVSYPNEITQSSWGYSGSAHSKGAVSIFVATQDGRFPTFELALKAARDGWPEKVKICEELLTFIDDRVRSLAPKVSPVYEMYGGVPDVGAFLSGDPENMIHKKETDTSKASSNRVVKIVLDVNCNAFGGCGEYAELRGALCMAVADSIEMSGRRSEIWISSGFAGSPGRIEFMVEIKKARDPLCLSDIAFACCCQDIERRMMFGCAENIGFRPGCFSGFSATDQGDIYIPYLPQLLVANKQTWISETLRILQMAGVEITE
jgi:hypothetical protein